MKIRLTIIALMLTGVFVFSGCAPEKENLNQNTAEEKSNEIEDKKENQDSSGYIEGMINIKSETENKINDSIEKREIEIMENL